MLFLQLRTNLLLRRQTISLLVFFYYCVVLICYHDSSSCSAIPIESRFKTAEVVSVSKPKILFAAQASQSTSL